MTLSIMHFLAAFAPGELLAIFIFNMVRKKLAGKGINNSGAIFKGILERFMVVVGLAMAIQSIITLFGAIKIGTRLKDANQEKISNDYFLIGNFISITIALMEYLLFTLLQQ
jgi:hypothetical protein